VRWTYRQVAETAFRFARELEERGIGKGERVLLWGPNSAEWVAAFFGCALRGVIVVPIDDAGAADFAQRVYQQVDGRLMVCSQKHVPPSIPFLIFEDLHDALSVYVSAPYDGAVLGPADVLEIIFTSGTTAEPKGVVITHGNVLGNIAPLEAEIEKYLKYERWVHPFAFLNLLPLSHVFGQFPGNISAATPRGTVIFQDALKPGEGHSHHPARACVGAGGGTRMLQSLKEKIERDLEERRPPAWSFSSVFKRRKGSISSIAGGSSGGCIVSSDGSSGRSFPAEPHSTA
jgi:long-chain acyl-CoA synthetase